MSKKLSDLFQTMPFKRWNLVPILKQPMAMQRDGNVTFEPIYESPLTPPYESPFNPLNHP